jgi:hypothetical protein
VTRWVGPIHPTLPGRTSHLDRIGPAGPSPICQTSRHSLPAVIWAHGRPSTTSSMSTVLRTRHTCPWTNPALGRLAAPWIKPYPSYATVLTSSTRAALIVAGYLVSFLALVLSVLSLAPFPVRFPQAVRKSPCRNKPRCRSPRLQRPCLTQGGQSTHGKVPTSWSPQLTRVASQSASHCRSP